MARKSKAKFELKGHTLPGINQKSETVNKADGRSPSSAFQMAEPGDSPLDINLLKGLSNLNPVKATKNIFGKAKGLLGKFGVGGGGAGGDMLKDKMAAKVDEKLDEKVDEALSEDETAV